MGHQLPELPYEKDALLPHISAETIEYHYGKHHKAYVDNINRLITGTEMEKLPLEDIIRRSSGGIFNNAAQVWNHTFYWNCLSPDGGGQPGGEMANAINKQFGTFNEFKEAFTSAAATLFGSGWAWLVQDAENRLSIETTSNAGNPIKEGKKALLTCDVWEHAYYIDYRNARAKYIDAFWNLVNWEFVAQNLTK
ncbi:MAG: Fe-Mn family superoxide dismutase [Dehalococcoidales bacterium]|nr:Fe-Mn family superoxide dismutase [Dehalococcoidales bacterium]